MNSNLIRIGIGAFAVLVALAVLLPRHDSRPETRDESLLHSPPPAMTPAPLSDAPSKETFGRTAGVALAAREGAAADGLPSGFQATDTAQIPSMIIRIGEASVEVDSLETAIALVTQLASRLGGYIANTSLQGGLTQVRSATLTLRIPSSRYDEALGGLRPIGDLETVNTNAQDVGEEYVDLAARVENARRLESRLVALLATRTGKLEDVLAVERELARVREQIERIEGRLRYLRGRVALSTLAVTVHESAPLVGHDPSTNPVAEAFRMAWRNFVSFVAASIAALGWIVPLGALAGLLVLGIRRVLGRAEPRPKGPGDAAEATA